MRYNFVNEHLLRTKIEEFMKDKDASKFADWVHSNVSSDFLTLNRNPVQDDE